MKKILVHTALITTTLLAAASPALAQVDAANMKRVAPSTQESNQRIETRQETTEQRREAVQTNVQQRVEDRCATVDSRTALIISRYEQNYPRHVEGYQKMSQVAYQLMAEVQVQGLDTAKLAAALTTLDTKVASLSEQSQAVVAQLQVAEQYACGESQGQFKAEMQKGRQLAQTAQKTMQEVRSASNTVRAEILALKQNYGKMRSSAQTNSQAR